MTSVVYLDSIVVLLTAPETPMTSIINGVEVNEHQVWLMLLDYVSKVYSC